MKIVYENKSEEIPTELNQTPKYILKINIAFDLYKKTLYQNYEKSEAITCDNLAFPFKTG